MDPGPETEGGEGCEGSAGKLFLNCFTNDKLDWSGVQIDNIPYKWLLFSKTLFDSEQ